MILLTVLSLLILTGLGLLIRDARKAAAELRIVRSALGRLPGIEATLENARADLRHVADEQIALMKMNDAFGKFLDAAIEELRDDRKKREAAPDDAWKAGDVAMSRMSQVRQTLQDLEAESLQEMLRKAG